MVVYITGCQFTMLLPQPLRLIERETFVWWEEPTTGRVVWRYSGLDHGELSVTLHGLMMMLQLYADSYSILSGEV